ncbi:MAG: RAMP superfamily CRISPR-associated protein [candidate division WOR-3 bacterium]
MVYHDKKVTYPDGTTDYDYYCVEAIPCVIVNQVSDLDRFDDKRLTGRLEATLITEQPLLIGSGEVEVEGGDNGVQRLQFARLASGSRLVIPGSSLKGAIRTYAEALSPSCRAVTDNCRRCPACTIFGSTDHQGRLCFADSVLGQGVATQKIRIVQRRGPKRECRGRKFYYFEYPKHTPGSQMEEVEVIPKDVRIVCTATFLNLTKWELGLILLAMGLGHNGVVKPFSLKLGGGRNRRLGRVRFLPETVKIECRTRYLEELVEKSKSAAKEHSREDLISAYIEWASKYCTAIAAIADKFQRGAPDGA